MNGPFHAAVDRGDARTGGVRADRVVYALTDLPNALGGKGDFTESEPGAANVFTAAVRVAVTGVRTRTATSAGVNVV